MKTLLILYILFFAACSNSSDDQKPVTVADLVNSGWSHFENSDLNSSLNDFLNAIALDSTNVPVLNGLGWTYLLLNDLSASESFFRNGILLDSTLNDLHAGLAINLASSEQFSGSIQSIDQVLNTDQTWAFQYGLDIDSSDLIVLKSLLFFLLEDYEKSLENIQLIDPLFTADINSTTGINELADKIESYNSGVLAKVFFN